MVPPCSRCAREAVFLSPDRGLHFCSVHFYSDFEKRFSETIHAGRLVREGDHVIVAFSGGKDSSVLLSLLARFSRELGITILAVTIDEGIPGYRDATIAAARSLTKALHVSHIILSFRTELGSDLAGMLPGRGGSPCSTCGIHRRRLLWKAASEQGGTVIATGHCLEDEAETSLMNILRGDIQGIRRRANVHNMGIPRLVKPLRSVPQREILLYALLKGLAPPLPECPYTHRSLRNEVRDLIKAYESRHPGTPRRITRGYEDLLSRHIRDEPYLTVDPQDCDPRRDMP